MTTVTDRALDWYQEQVLNIESGRIDTLALGDGEDSESEDPSGLDNELFRADDSENTVTIELGDDQATVVGEIEVTGGTEVPSDTAVTELMLYSDSDDVIVAIDNFPEVLIESGQTEQFEIATEITRE